MVGNGFTLDLICLSFFRYVSLEPAGWTWSNYIPEWSSCFCTPSSSHCILQLSGGFPYSTLWYFMILVVFHVGCVPTMWCSHQNSPRLPGCIEAVCCEGWARMAKGGFRAVRRHSGSCKNYKYQMWLKTYNLSTWANMMYLCVYIHVTLRHITSLTVYYVQSRSASFHSVTLHAVHALHAYI